MAIITRSAGKFEATTSTTGYPMWIEFTYGDNSMQFHHNEIADLEHVLQRMRAAIRGDLQPDLKHEVD